MEYRSLGRTGVAPGVTVNPDDNSYGANELTAQARRR
jgi:hypothetical protein